MDRRILLWIGLVCGLLLAGKPLIHYFQLESYQFPGYFRTLKRNLLKSVLPGFCMSILLLAALWVLSLIPDGTGWPAYLAAGCLLAAGGFAVGRLLSEKKAKKPFVRTPRIKRLYCVAFLVMLAVILLIALPLRGFGEIHTVYQRLMAALLLLYPFLLPLLIAFSGLTAWPIEKGISELYFRDAQRILMDRKDLIRIGITGSWGKTSVKFILGTLLEEKYHTLVTPASFNTPMGVTKVIRTKLEPGHRVFVSEMGARHVGDIREMCRLVHPQYGLLTSVGPQHLDTFKTLERVIKTKYELMEAIPQDGVCFFSDDGDICRKLYEKTDKEKILAGTDPMADDVWAEDIRTTPEGSSFTLCTRDGRFSCSTELLGELNIRNILLCAAVSLRLGLEPEQIVRGIRKIKPVEHRLQLIRNPSGITIIDDAFNSNIAGARQAFVIMKDMPGKHIIITPGMVELGDREAEMNREFGKAMAAGCDEAILIGKKRSEAISEGLLEAGFPRESIHIAANLDEATAVMRNMVKSGDTVLFENDLPDNYTE